MGARVDEPGQLALGPSGELPSVTGKREVALTPGQGLVVTDPGDVPDVLGDVDVVFPVMHGPWGQDGTLQGLLEMAGRPLRRRRACSPAPSAPTSTS